MLVASTSFMKTTNIFIALLCTTISSLADDMSLEGAKSPNGKREIIISSTPIKGVLGDPVIIHQISPPKTIDIVSFGAPSGEFPSVHTVSWNSRSNCFSLQGSCYRGEYMMLFVITDKGVVELPFPSLDDLKVDSINKLNKFHQEHAAELGEEFGFPSGGWSFVRWVDNDTFEMRNCLARRQIPKLGSTQRVVGWDYVITLKVSANRRSMKALKIKETIGFLDEATPK